MRLDTTATHGRPGKNRLSPSRSTDAALALMNLAGRSVDRNGTQGSTPGYAAPERATGQNASPDLLRPVGRRLEFGTPREDGVVGRKEHDAQAGPEAAPGGPVPKDATYGEGSMTRAPRRDSLEGTGGVEGGGSKGPRVAGEGPVRSPARGKGNITDNGPAASPRLQRPVLPPAAAAAGSGAGAAAAAGDAEPPPPPQRQRQQPVRDCVRRAAERPPKTFVHRWNSAKINQKDDTMRINEWIAKCLVDDAAMEKAKRAVRKSGASEFAGVVTVYARRRLYCTPKKFPGVAVEAYGGTKGVQWRLSKLEKLRNYLGVLGDAQVYRSVEVRQDGMVMLVVNLDEDMWDLRTVQETEESQPGVHEQQLEQEGDGRGAAGQGCVEHGSGQREADNPDDEGGEAAPQGTKRAQPEQQEQQQAGPGGEGGAGPSGLFAGGGAWQGADGAGGERPGKRQRPACSDTEDPADQGALPDGEGYPVLNASMDAEVQEMCRTYDMLVAAREQAEARAAALAVDKAALQGQLGKERKAKEAAERERDRERGRAAAAQQQVGKEKERADAAEAKVAAQEAQLQAERARAEAARVRAREADAKFRYIQQHLDRGKQ